MSVKDRRVSRESRGWSTPLQPQGTSAPKATKHSQEVMQNEPKEKEPELQSKRLFISVRSHQPSFTLQQMGVCTQRSPSPKVCSHLCVCRPALLLTTSLQKSLMALRHAFVLREARYCRSSQVVLLWLRERAHIASVSPASAGSPPLWL